MVNIKKNELNKFCIENKIDLLVLFGSFAKGAQKKSSDIDFAYYSRNELDDVVLLENLQEIFNYEIDIDIVNLEKEDLKPYLKYRIFNEGKVMYESMKNLFKMFKDKVYFEYLDSKRFDIKKNDILRMKIQ